MRCLILLVFLAFAGHAYAKCPTVTTDCPSPTFNNLSVGGTITGTITGTVAGNVSSASSTSTNSSTSRTLADRGADLVNVKDFGAVGNGSTNDTTNIQAAITYAAANAKGIYLPLGTYRVSQLNYTSGLKAIIGAGQYATTIKRIDNDVSIEYVVNVGAVTGINIQNLTIDGNKANNTVDGAGIVIIGGSQILIQGVTVQNAESSAGNNGWGVFIRNNGDAAAGTTSAITNSTIYANGGHGIDLDTSVKYLNITNNSIIGNTRAGITVTASSPASGSFTYIKVVGNTVTNNGNSGINLGTLGAGYDQTVTEYATISGNVASNNLQYGIVWQGSYGTISGNSAANNGNSGTFLFAGILANAAYSQITGNTITSNQTWGIDAGGCQYCSISGNTINDSYGSGTGAGTGLNLGAANHILVSANNFIANGARVGDDGGNNIAIHRYDAGGSYPFFPIMGSNISIIGNNFLIPATSTSYGIFIDQDASSIVVRDNVFTGGSDPTHMIYAQSNSVSISGNKRVDALSGASVTSAANLVVPDYADDVVLTGTTHAISTIQTKSQSDNAGTVIGILLTAAGTGCVSNPTVGFSGGGGSGAAATAKLNGSGGVGGFTITNPGSGYTSNPTVSVSGGSCSGATATAQVGEPNQSDGRKLTIINTSGTTQTLSGPPDITMSDQSIVQLTGQSGKLNEVSRAIH